MTPFGQTGLDPAERCRAKVILMLHPQKTPPVDGNTSGGNTRNSAENLYRVVSVLSARRHKQVRQT